MSGLLFLVELTLIPYALGVVAPNWRWWFGITLIIGGALTAVWVQQWMAEATPGYNEGLGHALGIAMFALITSGFAIGAGVRAITLYLASKGLPFRHVFMICCVGFALVPACWEAPQAWQRWKMRPPSKECSNAPFGLEIANANLRILAGEISSVSVGGPGRDKSYYFTSNAHLRQFCAINEDGRRSLKAALVAIDMHRLHKEGRTICSGTVPAWATTYCRARDSKQSLIDRVNFPLQLYIFSPDQISPGYFGGSRSSYQDSLNRKPGPYLFFTSSERTPSGEPLTFQCNTNGNGYWCTVSYSWNQGASITYAFRADKDDVVARGERIDRETRTFLDGLKSGS